MPTEIRRLALTDMNIYIISSPQSSLELCDDDDDGRSDYETFFFSLRHPFFFCVLTSSYVLKKLFNGNFFFLNWVVEFFKFYGDVDLIQKKD